MDKFEDYINKSMTDHTPADDGWNIPSEDMWMKASTHFPKEEKRRWFLWLYIGMGLSCLVALFFFFGQHSENTSEKFTPQDLAATTTLTDNEESQDPQITNTTTQESNKAEVNKMSEVKEVANINSSIVESVISKNVIKQSSSITKNNSLSHKTATISESERPVIPDSSHPQSEKSLSQIPKNDFDSYVTSKVGPSVSTTSSLEFVNDRPVMIESFLQLPMMEQEQVFVVSEREIIKIDGIVMDDMTSVKISDKFLLPQQELTLGSTYFLLSALKGIDLGEEPRDDVFIDVSIPSINLGYTKWIRPTVSLRSGLHYAHLDGHIDFSDYEILEQDDIEELANFTYGEILNSSNLKSRSSELAQDGSTLPFVEIGEEVRFHGNIGVVLKAAQIPLFINKHWYKKRMEFYVGAGPTLELVWATNKAIDFNVEHKGLNYNLTLKDPNVKDNYLDYSIYALGGMKYYINQHYNLELALRVNTSEQAFSGLDLGFSYRW